MYEDASLICQGCGNCFDGAKGVDNCPLCKGSDIEYESEMFEE